MNFLENREKSFQDVIKKAAGIVSGIESGGERALLEYVLKFDGFRAGSVSDLLVKRREIDNAYRLAGKSFIQSMKKAVKNVESFHREQMKRRSGFVSVKKGLTTGERLLPVERVGVYIPGGSAAYPSSAVMNVIPARTAGVPEIIAATPPSAGGAVNPYTLSALGLAGVSRIYKMGGAHAVAAMAFGAGMARVHKITGPGNAYVAAAKLLIQQRTNVGIDSVAGPTEVVIIADGRAAPAFAAADMLAQAEHGGDSMPVLITASRAAAGKIRAEISRQAGLSPRREIINKCLRDNAAVIILKSMKRALELSDRIAPEHLGLHVEKPWEIMARVRNAGAVFLGGYSPETAGDYFAGPNHVLPTSGRAVYSSPLGVDDFLKRINFLHSDRTWIEKSSADIIRIAEAEGLYAHAEAVRLRLKQKKGRKK